MRTFGLITETQQLVFFQFSNFKSQLIQQDACLKWCWIKDVTVIQATVALLENTLALPNLRKWQ